MKAESRTTQQKDTSQNFIPNTEFERGQGLGKAMSICGTSEDFSARLNERPQVNSSHWMITSAKGRHTSSMFSYGSPVSAPHEEWWTGSQSTSPFHISRGPAWSRSTNYALQSGGMVFGLKEGLYGSTTRWLTPTEWFLFFLLLSSMSPAFFLPSFQSTGH